MMFPKAVGANPTPIAFAEVYLALQQGVVDAQENPLPTIEAKKFYEVQKNIVLTGHITDALLTIVGGSAWDSMDEADRNIARRAREGGRGRAPARYIVNQENKLAQVFKRPRQQRQRGRPHSVPRGHPEAAHGPGRDLGPGGLRQAAGDPVIRERRRP